MTGEELLILLAEAVRRHPDTEVGIESHDGRARTDISVDYDADLDTILVRP